MLETRADSAGGERERERGSSSELRQSSCDEKARLLSKGRRARVFGFIYLRAQKRLQKVYTVLIQWEEYEYEYEGRSFFFSFFYCYSMVVCKLDNLGVFTLIILIQADKIKCVCVCDFIEGYDCIFSNT